MPHMDITLMLPPMFILVLDWIQNHGPGAMFPIERNMISHGPGWKRDQIHDPGAMNFKTLRVQLSAIYDTEVPQYPVCR